LPQWICLKCGYKWVDDSKVEPRYCPICGSPTIYVPKVVKAPKYRA
jgi:rubrerythrin